MLLRTNGIRLGPPESSYNSLHFKVHNFINIYKVSFAMLGNVFTVYGD